MRWFVDKTPALQVTTLDGLSRQGLLLFAACNACGLSRALDVTGLAAGLGGGVALLDLETRLRCRGCRAREARLFVKRAADQRPPAIDLGPYRLMPHIGASKHQHRPPDQRAAPMGHIFPPLDGGAEGYAIVHPEWVPGAPVGPFVKKKRGY